MTLTLQNFTFAVMSFFFNSSSHLYSLELVTFFFVVFSAVKSHYFSLILTQTHFVQHHFSHLFFYLCLVLLFLVNVFFFMLLLLQQVFTTLLKMILSTGEEGEEKNITSPSSSFISAKNSVSVGETSSSSQTHSSASDSNNFLHDKKNTNDRVRNLPSPAAVSSAVSIMNKYSCQIKASEALKLLPLEETRIQDLEPFLRRVTQSVLQERRMGQLFRHLLLSQYLQVQGTRIRLQQAHKVVIEDSDLCRVCQKRIGKRYVYSILSSI